MVSSKKHRKKSKKTLPTMPKENYSQPSVNFDASAYKVYQKFEMAYPCLSLDILTDDYNFNKGDQPEYPWSVRFVAGAQTHKSMENNFIYVVKMSDIKPLKQDDDDLDDEEDDDDSDDPSADSSLPKVTYVRVPHKGCVNRIKVIQIGGKTLSASWSDLGKVHIYNLTVSVQATSDKRSNMTYKAQNVEPKPIFTFGGHLSEGYAIEWSPLNVGSLATGDCKKNIHIWTMKNQSHWNVDQQPLAGHENSVEDLKWSPEDSSILASCSVDKSIKIWDLRNKTLERCVTHVPDSHSPDVNVIDWNKRCKNLLISGGDDGAVKIWDVRMLKAADGAVPVAKFDYHKKPITSIEWNPFDDTVIAVASEDDNLTIWDLAVERDVEEDEKEMDADASTESEPDEEDMDDNDDEGEDTDEKDEEEDKIHTSDHGSESQKLKDVPEQMLFLHEGQKEIKELHWHPQLQGLVISTALDGINIFKTISA